MRPDATSPTPLRSPRLRIATRAVGRRFHRVILAAAAAVLGTVMGCGQPAAVPSNPGTTAPARDLLAWLSTLPQRADNRVVIGQYISRALNNTDGRTPAEAWTFYYEELAALSGGQQVALAGFDFSTRAQFQKQGSDNTPADAEWRDFALEHARNGGLLRLMWHAGNPWTDDSSWSEIPPGHALRELITPGNPAFERWKGWLAALADRLQVYQDLQVPILWAPLHEANGDWFWWGQKASNDDYIAVWQHLYTYLTHERKLNHLLWGYSPSNHYAQARAIAQYPGNNYVDLISPDKYDSTDATLYREFTQDRYGKVFAWGEIGETDVPIDNRQFIEEIRTQFPRVVFYMQWADNRIRRSIRSNHHPDAVMQDDWIITLSDMPTLRR